LEDGFAAGDCATLLLPAARSKESRNACGLCPVLRTERAADDDRLLPDHYVWESKSSSVAW